MFIKEYVVCSNLTFSQHQRLKSRIICCELEQQKKFTDRPTNLIFQRSGYAYLHGLRQTNPISNQFIELEVQYEHLIELKLADSTDGESNLKVDILIGGDNYWKFVTGKVVRGRSGPVALETIMSWV